MPTRSLLTMHLDSLVLLSALGVLYSLAVELKEFDSLYAVTVPGIQVQFIFFLYKY